MIRFYGDRVTASAQRNRRGRGYCSEVVGSRLTIVARRGLVRLRVESTAPRGLIRREIDNHVLAIGRRT
jgi:hypothetical protein